MLRPSWLNAPKGRLNGYIAWYAMPSLCPIYILTGIAIFFKLSHNHELRPVGNYHVIGCQRCLALLHLHAFLQLSLVACRLCAFLQLPFKQETGSLGVTISRFLFRSAQVLNGSLCESSHCRHASDVSAMSNSMMRPESSLPPLAGASGRQDRRCLR